VVAEDAELTVKILFIMLFERGFTLWSLFFYDFIFNRFLLSD
jgi:hypothetical protein